MYDVYPRRTPAEWRGFFIEESSYYTIKCFAGFLIKCIHICKNVINLLQAYKIYIFQTLLLSYIKEQILEIYALQIYRESRRFLGIYENGRAV